jgi:5-methylcytosine-specific restriction protein A
MSRDQLFDLYVEKGLSTYAIAKIVNRNPKRVYEWLVGYDIQPRPRGWDTVTGGKPFHDKGWLEHEYLIAKRPAADIAKEYGVTENNVLFFLQKHGIPARSMERIRAEKYWGASGEKNPMFGRHGSKNPHWKGGVTPERQAFYLSRGWKQISQQVWRRDRALCQRCGIKAGLGVEIHIHHKVSFAYRPQRAVLSNLILLCDPCHNWVHSNRNKNKEWIEDEPPLEAYSS